MFLEGRHVLYFKYEQSFASLLSEAHRIGSFAFHYVMYPSRWAYTVKAFMLSEFIFSRPGVLSVGHLISKRILP